MNEPRTETRGAGGGGDDGPAGPASDGPCADLTVAILSCNNERTIEAALAGIADLAGEIVVVDSGSTDGTLEIVRHYGARVINHEWEGHVRQKQFALDQCTTPWAFSLDSDESLEPALVDAVRAAVVRNDPKFDGYEMNRRTCVGGQWLKHAWQPEWRTRLVRTGGAATWAGYDPHDTLQVVSGRVGRLSGIMRHDAYENVADLLRKQIGHGLRAAESYYQMGRRGSVLMLLLSPLGAVLKQLVLKGAWMDGWRGWVAAFSMGVGTTTKQLQLMELTHDAVRATPQGPPPTIPE
ncbi:MAG: glycosyltransferase family 2 protein [Planctomycetes bacterium]|nr:glycosyltransferase family 2 protein [Planctomycetota bacterium]NOG54599.1 glycosyltransferase family 2 protein [Planctomycetota bacterium]